jgi:hypothetical protein
MPRDIQKTNTLLIVTVLLFIFFNLILDAPPTTSGKTRNLEKLHFLKNKVLEFCWIFWGFFSILMHVLSLLHFNESQVL